MECRGFQYALLSSIFFLSACGGGGSNSDVPTASAQEPAPAVAGDRQERSGDNPSRVDRPLPEAAVGGSVASCDTSENLEGDRHYRVQMPSRVDGAAIVFEVFQPRQFDCRNGHPLILQGHGFGGSRSTSASNDPLSPIQPLVDAGYTVISIDQRGHGESGGSVRVMDPEFAGQDLVQIVDWAEANLDYLAYEKDNLLLGAVGGSYGGGFQYMLYNVDPDRRMDAMVPQITWHDLTYSLSPGDVPKGYWAMALSLLGDTLSQGSMDPFIRSTLLDGLVSGRMSPVALDFFFYHGPSYFADNERNLSLFDAGNTDSYLLDPIVGELPVTADGRYVVKTPTRDPYPVDVLMFQGIRDHLFPLNEAWENYRIFDRAGGDVRLLTYPFGHQYLKPDESLLADLLQEGQFYTETIPEFPQQGLNPLASCGDIGINEATLAWFDEKLRGRGDADSVISTGQDLCLTLSEGDAIGVPEMPVGGDTVSFGGGTLPWTVLIGANPLPQVQSLGTMAEDGVIAGIPTARIRVGTGSDSLDDACLDQSDPLTGTGTCDAIFFVGLTVLNDGDPSPIDGQVIPVRGFGEHELELTGIAERLNAGDELGLVVYGQHSTFAGIFSRDLTSYVVTLEGEISLPLLAEDGQSKLSLQSQ